MSRPSLRRRAALTLGATFVLGYVVVAAAVNVILRLWYSFHWLADQGPNGGFFTPGLFSGPVYAGSFTTSTRILFVVLLLPALVLAGWGLWIAAGGLLQPLSATAQTVRQLGPQNLGQRIRMDAAAPGLQVSQAGRWRVRTRNGLSFRRPIGSYRLPGRLLMSLLWWPPVLRNAAGPESQWRRPL